MGHTLLKFNLFKSGLDLMEKNDAVLFSYNNFIHHFKQHMFLNLDNVDPNLKHQKYQFFWFVLAVREADDTRMDTILIHFGKDAAQEKNSHGYLIGTIRLDTGELNECRAPYKTVKFNEDLIVSEFQIKNKN